MHQPEERREISLGGFPNGTEWLFNSLRLGGGLEETGGEEG